MRLAAVFLAMVSIRIAFCAVLPEGSQFPKLEAKSFGGKQLTLPDAARDKVALLLFTFTKEAGATARTWSERFEREFGAGERFVVYHVMLLEDVPRLLRGLVTSQIRKGFPAVKHDRVLPVFQGETEWKDRLGFQEDAWAYLALLDTKGIVRLLSSGPFREDEFQRIAKLAKLLAK